MYWQLVASYPTVNSRDFYSVCFYRFWFGGWDLGSDLFNPYSANQRQSRLQQTTFINSFHCFSEKIRLNVSRQRIRMKNQALFSSIPSDSSARQRIRMKNQAIFSSKDKS